MAEFLETLVITEVADIDVIPCVDVSDQNRLKQLPFSTLKASLGNGGGGAATGPTSPDPATTTVWNQPHPQGGPAIEWLWAPTRQRWVSREVFRHPLFSSRADNRTYKLSVTVPTAEIYVDSINIRYFSESRFNGSQQAIVSLYFVDSAKQRYLFGTVEFDQNNVPDRYGESFSHVGQVLPSSDVVYYEVKATSAGGAPDFKELCCDVSFRAVYVPNPP